MKQKLPPTSQSLSYFDEIWPRSPHLKGPGLLVFAVWLAVEVQQSGNGLLVDVAVHRGLLGGQVAFDRGDSADHAAGGLVFPGVTSVAGIAGEPVEVLGCKLQNSVS